MPLRNPGSYDPRPGDYPYRTVDELVNLLNQQLGSEGYAVSIEQAEPREGGFQRLYVRKGTVDPDLYLDVRVGKVSPFGPTIEMASSKPGTYGVPGFSRLVGKERSTPLNTFGDFLRSVYEGAEEQQKPPSQMPWSIYQQGYAPRGVPAAGDVLTPSSSQGMRSWLAQKVRFAVPEGVERRGYLQQLQEELATGTVPGLQGYMLESVRQRSLIPATSQIMQGTGLGQTELQAFALRGLGSEFKSQTLLHEARNYMDVALVRNPKTGMLERLQPTYPSVGTGIRYGWTQLSGTLPGEETPRTAWVKPTLLSEMPDMPGAMSVSPGFWRTEPGKTGTKIFGFGEKQNLATELGITGFSQLAKYITSGQFTMEGTADRLVRSGQGRFEIGSIGGQSLTLKRRGYNITVGKPSIYIPRYYDPADPSGEGLFSNVYRSGFKETTEMVDYMREKYGQQVDVQGFSSVGTYGEENPAQVYVTAPILGINPPGAKGIGTKAGLYSSMANFTARILGLEKPVGIEAINPEAKIPSRALMGHFLAMNMRTQLGFMKQFLPSGGGSESVRNYIRSSYAANDPAKVNIDISTMADIFYQKSASGTGFQNADTMFADIWKNILTVQDPKKAKKIWNYFRVGLPVNQMMEGNLYSRSQMEQVQNLLKEYPDLEGKVSFVPYSGSSKHPLTDIFRMHFEIPGMQQTATSAIISSAYSFTPEYQSSSSYVNPKGLMALAENFPEMAREVGTLGLVPLGGMLKEGWTGGTGLSVAGRGESYGWKQMQTWLAFQKPLSEFVPRYPANRVDLDPDMAVVLQKAHNQARAFKTTENRLASLRTSLEQFPKEMFGIDPNIDMTTAFFADPSTGTLIPPLNAVENVESYKTGLLEGETQTYIGDMYMRYFGAAISGAAAPADVSYSLVNRTRTAFMNKISSVLQPKGQGGKDVYRNILGANLPGMRGGRYMGSTWLDLGEAYASDDYIRKMLTSSGFIKPQDVSSVMKYLESGDDAFLPMFMQRFPDVSGRHQWLPLRLRSGKGLKSRGKPVPTGVGAEGFLHINPMTNVFSVGDFDWDPNTGLLAPISDIDPSTNKHTGIWKTPPGVMKEFERGMTIYDVQGKGQREALQGMFGSMWPALDIQRKTLGEYRDSFTRASLPKRINASGSVPLLDLLTEGAKVGYVKGGMGVAYNRRILTEDIMEAVLGNVGDDVTIRQKAYESGAYQYQSYLDRMAVQALDYSKLETMFNTVGFYSISGEPGKMTWEMKYKESLQDDPQASQKEQFWPRLGGYGTQAPRYVLGNLIGAIGDMPEPRMTNAQLAWGFGSVGRRGELFDILEKAGSGANKAHVLWGQASRTGGPVGFNSAFYLSTMYKGIERLIKKNPGLEQDPSFIVPWINGQNMRVSDIVRTPEYQATDILNRLVLKNEGALNIDEIMKLGNLAGGRLGQHMVGFVRNALSISGGVLDMSSLQKEYADKLSNLQVQVGKRVMEGPLRVHASELGSLASANIPGWSPVSDSEGLKSIIRYEAGYKVMLRALGLPQVMGERDYRGTPILSRVSYETVAEAREGMSTGRLTSQQAIEAGNRFEAAFGAKGEPGLRHVGQLAPGGEPLSYKIGRFQVVGTPDFLGFDEATGSLRIVDTKLAMQDPMSPQGATSMARVKSYGHRIQQIAYAYGLEKLAREGTEEDWTSQMRSFRFTSQDRDQMLKMRSAAGQGRFKISLQPGNVERGTLETYSPIGIDYGESERRELEGLTGFIEQEMFSEKVMQRLAGSMLGALKTPGGTPWELGGMYARTAKKVPSSIFKMLEEVVQPGRMAGGGDVNDPGAKRLRVGEGGPEEIVISKSGIRIVPTHDLPESRAMRGENRSLSGYGPERAQGGFQFQGFGNLPPTPPPPPPSAAPASPSGNLPPNFWQQILDAVSEIGQASSSMAQAASGFSQPKVVFQGARTPVDLSKLARQVQVGQAAAAQFMRPEQAPAFASGVEQALLESFRAAGQGPLAEQYEALIQAGEPMVGTMMAQAFETLPTGQFLPRIAPFVKQARVLGRLITPMQQAGQVLASRAGLGALPPNLMPGMSVLSNRILAMRGALTPEMQAQGLTEAEAWQTMRSTEEQAAAVQMVSGRVSDPLLKESRYTYARPESLERLARAQQKLIETTEDLSKGHGNLFQQIRLRTEQEKGIYETRAASRGINLDVIRGQAGPLVQGGVAVQPTEAVQMLQRGEALPSEFDAYMRLPGAEAQYAAAERATGGGGMGRGLGMMARRLFGGFGLMYMRSIMGLAMGPIQYGGPEAAQEAMQIGMQAGPQFGGMMFQAPESVRARQIAAAQFGGLGWEGVQGVLNRYPGITTAANIGMSGLAAGGFGAYVAGLAGLGSFAGPIGLAVGGLTSLGVGAMAVGGALQQPFSSGAGAAFSGLDLTQGGARNIFGAMLNPAAWGMGLEALTGRSSQAGSLSDYYLRYRAIREAQQNQPGYNFNQDTFNLLPGYEGLRMKGELARQWSAQWGLEIGPVSQAMRMQGQYNLPWTYQGGGQMNYLSALIQQGIPVEQLAQGIAGAPTLGYGQRQALTGRAIEDLTRTQGYLTPEVVANLAQGQQRYAALGVLAPTYVGPEMNMMQYQQQLGQLSTAGADIFTQRYALEERRRRAGFTAGALPTPGEYAGEITPDRYFREQRGLAMREFATSVTEGLQRAFQQFGILPMAQQFQGMTTMQQMQMQNQLGFGMGMGQQLMAGGIAPGMAQNLGAAYGTMDPRNFSMYQGMAQFNPLRWVQWMNQNPGAAGQLGMSDLQRSLWMGQVPQTTIPGIGGAMIPNQNLFFTDVSNQGIPTGLPWGSTSLRMGPTPGAQVAQQIWGNWQGRTDISQPLVGQFMQGGMQAAQMYMATRQAEYQMAQAGIGIQQLQLQARYQPQFWAMEDRQRQLGYGYQEWQFGLQGRQLEAQNRWFYENQALNMRQSQQQRGWAREDWGYQDVTRNLQWGWRQEDFAEQARFMTGRERMGAERQMRRETLMFGLEGEQIDRQRERQESMWKLEDERFRVQRKQHEESLAFQREQLRKAEEYFNARRKLEEEQIELQRKYWKENWDLQMKAAQASAGAAKEQILFNKTMLEFQQYSDTARGSLNLFNEDTLANLHQELTDIDPVFKGFIDRVRELSDAMGGDQNKREGPPVPPAGPKPTSFNPWNNSVYRQNASGASTGTIQLIVNVGGQKLKDIIIEAVSQEVNA